MSPLNMRRKVLSAADDEEYDFFNSDSKVYVIELDEQDGFLDYYGQFRGIGGNEEVEEQKITDGTLMQMPSSYTQDVQFSKNGCWQPRYTSGEPNSWKAKDGQKFAEMDTQHTPNVKDISEAPYRHQSKDQVTGHGYLGENRSRACAGDAPKSVRGRGLVRYRTVARENCWAAQTQTYGMSGKANISANSPRVSALSGLADPSNHFYASRMSCAPPPFSKVSNQDILVTQVASTIKSVHPSTTIDRNLRSQCTALPRGETSNDTNVPDWLYIHEYCPARTNVSYRDPNLIANPAFLPVFLVCIYLWKVHVLWRQHMVTSEHPGGFLRQSLRYHGSDDPPFDPRLIWGKTDRSRDLVLRMIHSSILIILNSLMLYARVDASIWTVLNFLFSALRNVHDPRIHHRVLSSMLLFRTGRLRIAVRPLFKELGAFRAMGILISIEAFLKSLITVCAIFVLQSIGPYTFLSFWCILSTIYYISQPYLTPRPKEFTPLPDENHELGAEISFVASQMRFPLKDVFVGDLNDHVAGWSSSRCLYLSNKLIEEHSIDEVVAAVAHTLALWKLKFRLYTLIAYQGYILLVFCSYLFVVASDALFSELGFDSPVPIAVKVGVFLRFHFSFLDGIAVVYHLIVRYLAFKADYVVSRLGKGDRDVYYNEGLQNYLTKPEESGHHFWPFHPLYSAYFFAYPTMSDRIVHLRLLWEDALRKRRKRNRRRRMD